MSRAGEQSGGGFFVCANFLTFLKFKITNLRFVLSDMEKKVNECDAKILVLNEEKMELVDRNTRMAQEFEKEKLRLSNEYISYIVFRFLIINFGV